MQIATKPLTYKDADTTLNGIFFWDDSQTTKRPGVLVVHGGGEPPPFLGAVAGT